MRPLFYHYPEDKAAWDIDETYFFGRDLLVAPVYTAGATTRRTYLPAGDRWREVSTGKIFDGGRWVDACAPLDTIPLFVREGAEGLPF